MREEPTRDRFRLAMGRFATGVTVLTTVTGGHDHAMTANAVASVSMEPMLVLACVEVDARFHDAVAEAGLWGISVLDAQQRPTADWLATQGRPLHGQLDRVPHHRGSTGVALLDGALATIECRTTDMHPAGDHSIVVGEVVSLGVAEHPGAALTYYRSRYGSLA
ncbi:NADH-FMN oxidoreductase RutF, flavin reductase (DIM6/NTAB) family [Pedococcus cremeus]|uniref:NADH-FMN oxidoreductase RutF, flavin reductase (DIM6/NTAB) family n=1 Tax=Pedococcus cremeus TaxID=587636 RepID=A0A1H9S2P8_9MICO|nr:MULTISPECIES: flavin reductase family protein [Intrasporangiaceae]TQJ49685.1 flavin reductase (DIM6/NTAB) family NADH-FMN oxidoreductase RutF [Phycicoccus sp. SLBN-51]SER78419.1 NADH-FMN oxidoreductase RutF, flavin reductase (DIM6/NTAB) family [Pedococcus cremeus]